MIKNIIFDCGNVLMRFNFSKTLQKVTPDEETFRLLSPIATDKSVWPIYDLGLIDAATAAKRLKQSYPSHLHPYIQKFMDIWPDTFSPDGEMIELVKLLKQKGYKLYILSNFPKEFEVLEQQYDFFSLFDGKVISSHVHMVKPNAEIYLHLLEKYNLKAEECIFADDMDYNAAGAEKVGIKGYTFTTAESFKEYLKTNHIL